MHGTTKILSLIVRLVGLIGHRPIEFFGLLQLGHYPNPTTMKFLTTNFRNRLIALQAATDRPMVRSVIPLLVPTPPAASRRLEQRSTSALPRAMIAT